MTYETQRSQADMLRSIGRGPGGFGRGGGPGFKGGHGLMGGGGMPGGRKFSSADLQLVLLLLLEDQPSHGYQLIQALEAKSNGFYTPSPGMIYPALTYLGEAGYAASEQDGNRKLYRLTAEGHTYLDTHRAGAEAMIEALGRIGRRMEQVREAFAGLDALDPIAADELHRARHALKHALFRLREGTPDEARRITLILDRATAEILGPATSTGQKAKRHEISGQDISGKDKS